MKKKIGDLTVRQARQLALCKGSGPHECETCLLMEDECIFQEDFIEMSDEWFNSIADIEIEVPG
jgi:hypothetical protein